MCDKNYILENGKIKKEAKFEEIVNVSNVNKTIIRTRRIKYNIL